MFNYSTNFKERLMRQDNPMSKSNITRQVRTKKSSEPRANFSNVTAKRVVNKKTTLVNTPKEKPEPLQSGVLDNFSKKVDDLVKPGS